jgi:predicted DNA-binding transcriptional regulator AlpA
MFDAQPSQPDVEIDLILWLNLRIRMTAMPKTFKIGEHVRWKEAEPRSILAFRESHLSV